MSAQLVGCQADVDYTIDVQGQVYEVWILTPAEAAKLLADDARRSRRLAFDPIAQTWTKP